MLIKGCNLNEETVLEIGKFSILWNCFEHDWYRNNCNPTKIRNITKTISVSAEAQARLANVLNERRH